MITLLQSFRVNEIESQVNDLKSVLRELPQGMCKVTNIYVNPETNRIIIQYDDTKLVTEV